VIVGLFIAAVLLPAFLVGVAALAVHLNERDHEL